MLSGVMRLCSFSIGLSIQITRVQTFEQVYTLYVAAVDSVKHVKQ